MTESEILYRSATLTMAPATGRTVYGLVIPYGQTAEIRGPSGGYRERFAAGSFRRSIAERGGKIKLFIGHDVRKLPIGKAVELHEQPDGVHAAFELAATRDGDEALELVKAGVADAFSVGFRPIRQHVDGDVIVRTEAALREVSLVGVPVYDGATVAGVRSEGPFVYRSVAEASLRLLEI